MTVNSFVYEMIINIRSMILRNSILRRLPLRKLALVIGILLLDLFLSSRGDISRLGVLTGGAWALVLFYYSPMPAVFMLLVLSTNVFMFIEMQNLPSWQLGPGLMMNAQDSLLTIMFGVSVIKLYRRREQILFLKPILVLAGIVVLLFIFDILLGITDLDNGMNIFRIMFTYVFYFIIIASVDSPRRLRILIGMVFVIVAVSVVNQMIEAALGYRLSLGLVSNEYYGAGESILVAGQVVPYLWNRATIYLYLGFFLALGASFSGMRVYRFLPIVLLGALGFVIALIRSWQLYVLAGILTLLALQRGHAVRILVSLVILATGALGVISAVSSLGAETYGGDLLNVWVARMQTVFNYKEESTFIGRIVLWQRQLADFWKYPLTGYGFSPKFMDLWNSDTGFINTLLGFGIVGLGAIIFLIVTVLRKGYKLWRNLRPSVERGYLAGVLGLWAGSLVGYSFNWDFFTMQDGIWLVTLAMAVIDRIKAFYMEESKIVMDNAVDNEPVSVTASMELSI